MQFGNLTIHHKNKLANSMIIGNGMIAKNLINILPNVQNILFFASGVSDSSCQDQVEYDRESDLLYKAIKICKNMNLKLVYFSSAGTIYGTFDNPKNEDSPLFPITLYGKHNVLMESIIINSGVDYIIARLPNVIGPNQNRKQLFPFLVSESIKQKTISIYKNAGRDCIDIDDVCYILESLLNMKLEKQIIIIASGYSIPVNIIYNQIKKIMHMSNSVILLDKGEKQIYDVGKLNKLLNGKIKFTDQYYISVIKKYMPAYLKQYR